MLCDLMIMPRSYLQLTSDFMQYNVQNLVNIGSKILKNNHIEKYKYESRLILSKSINVSEASIICNKEKEVSNNKSRKYLKNIYSRIQGKPISRIFGCKEFYSRKFLINKFTLDPRPDSEILVDTALKFIRKINKKKISILDLGTGSGCLIISIILEALNFSDVIISGHGIDISSKAITIAKKNSVIHNLDKIITFQKSDWFSYIKNSFDVIVSNPPYINLNHIEKLSKDVKDFDPKISINGGFFGLDCYKKIAKNLKFYLKNNGFFCTEIYSKNIYSIIKVFENKGFEVIEILKDLQGNYRTIVFNLKKK